MYPHRQRSGMLQSSKKDLRGRSNRENVCIEKKDGHVESFVRYVQLYSDKTLTTLKNTTLVAYPNHASFFKFRLGESEG